jgi:aspartyl protease family protein
VLLAMARRRAIVRQIRCGFCAWLLALLPAPVLAAVYKCVDDGRVTYSASPCGSNAQLLSAQGGEPQQEPQGTLTLYLRSDHSYRVQGSVNSQPVEFVVDTVASSSTVLSQRVAAAAGIRSCTGLGIAATANGMVRNCVATVPELSFGLFHVNNLLVTILPGLNVDGLLGMDVLRHMKVEQHGDVMYISN